MQYRNIYDVTLDDLVSLCRDCHELVERAKKLHFIHREHEFADILMLTSEWISNRLSKRRKHYVLDRQFLLWLQLKNPSSTYIRKMCDIVGSKVTHDFLSWEGCKITGSRKAKMEWLRNNVGRLSNKRMRNDTGRNKMRIHY